MLQFIAVLLAIFETCQIAAANNAPPTLKVENKWEVLSNTAPGTQIRFVRGFDPEGQPITYGILPGPKGFRRMGDGSDFFGIHNVTGAVYLKKPLELAQTNLLNMYIVAKDAEGVGAKVEIIVEVIPSDGVVKSLTNQLPSVNFVQPVVEPILPVPTSIRQSTPSNGDTSVVMTSADPKRSGETVATLHTNATVTESRIPSTADTIVVQTVVPIAVIAGCLPLLALGIWFIKRNTNKSNGVQKDAANNGLSSDGDPLSLPHLVGKKALSNRYESYMKNQELSPQNSMQKTNSTADKWEFPRHRLHIIGILGEGCFGQVWKCEALNIQDKEGKTIVAVKTLKEQAGEKERKDLLTELEIMKLLKPHINVVSLLGCCTEKDPIFVIMELVNGGKLQTYLRQSRADHYYGNLHGSSQHLSSRDLTSFAFQVARGMEYLAANGVIHRDLAARNVLITEDRICKVADFGFARDVMASHVYERKSEGRLPIRWMAPESLYDNIFTTKTDVWSFGVLMWEIITLGSTPYPGMAAADVMKRIREGYRLEKPEHCKRELYNIMFYCWDRDPKQRPTFTEIVPMLEKLISSETDYVELENFPDHSYYNVVEMEGEWERL